MFVGTPVEIDTHSSLLIQLSCAEQQALAEGYDSVIDSPSTHLSPSTYHPAESEVGWFVGRDVGAGVGEGVIGDFVG